MDHMKAHSSRFALLSVLFFLSGSAGLILEVIWTRKIALVFGSTIQSASITIGSFMLGLGLGAYLCGRYGRNLSNPVAGYSILQCVIGISGYAVTLLIPSLAGISVNAAGVSLASIAVKSLASFTLLLLPCTAMGATLPLLTALFSRENPEHFAAILGSLYGINTLGAALGTFLTDFFLVERLGVNETAFFACMLNIIVGGIAFFLTVQKGARPPQPPEEESGTAARFSGKIFAIFFVTGFFGISSEIVWARILVFFDGADVFAFSSMLTTFLVGVFLGSIVISRVIKNEDRAEITLYFLMALLAVLTFTTVFTSALIIPLRDMILKGLKLSFQSINFLTNAFMMLPSTFILGSMFPLTARLLKAQEGNAGSTVGKSYLWNTFGSICGSLMAGFVLIPAFGIQGTLSILTIIMLVSSGLLFLLWRGGGKVRYAAAVISLGLVLIPLCTPGDRLQRVLYGKDQSGILCQSEDQYGSIALIRQWEKTQAETVVNLITDGFNMAGNSIDAKCYTYSAGLIPTLLHRDPRKVLVICVGLANTVYACTQMNLTREVDCVELSKKVIDAVSRVPEIAETLQSPKVRLIINDGRNYLLATKESYDVITAEPPPPNHAGIVNLYSREYFQLSRKRLREGGIVAHWLPISQMTVFDTRTIIRAFVDVFPYPYVWSHGTDFLCLIGSAQEIIIDYPVLEERVRQNEKILSSVGLDHTELIVAGLLKGPEALRQYTAGTPPLTDNHPYLQYVRSRGRYDKNFFYFTADEHPVKIISGASPQLSSDQSRMLGRAEDAFHTLYLYLYASSGNKMLDHLVRAGLARNILNQYPRSLFFHYLLDCLESKHAYLLRKARENPDDDRTFFEIARIEYYHSEYDDALKHLESAIEQCSDGNRPYYRLFEALICEDKGDIEGARRIYEDSLSPGDGDNETIRSFSELRLKKLGK